MDKDKIEMKATMESAAVAEYLTALAKGFKSGVITVEKDGETLTLTPAEVAEVEVEARVKKDKARFSLEVTWRLAQEQDDPSQLKISAEAPKADKKDDKPSDKPSDKKDAKGEDKKSHDQKSEMKKSEMKKPEDQKADDKKAAPAAASPSGPMVKVISTAASSAASPAASSAASPAQKPAAPGTTPAGGSKA